MANTYLGVSTSSSGVRTKWTTSFWVKRSNLSSDNVIFGSYLDGSNQDTIRFTSDNKLQWYSYQASSFSNGGNLLTNRLFRDTNAWYHIVCRWDTNNSTADDRMKIWVNGVEETSFNSRTNPSSGRESLISYQGYTTIGRLGSDYLDGCLSHIHFCDNQSYQASDFGLTDSTTGEWKINTSPSVSYGNRGYFALKDGNSLTDQSGLGNNLTLQGGTLTKTEDSPSNVFCTWNPLDNFYQESTFAHGNTQVRGKSPGIQYGYETFNTGTLGMTSGKYYWEIKFSANDSGATEIGIVDNVTTSSSQQLQQRTYGWSYSKDGTVKNNSSSVGGTWGTYTTGDIIGVALNLDDEQDGLNKLYFSKNGVWQNGSDPSNASSVTGVVGVTKPENNSSGFYFPAGGDENAGNSTLQANFGNGYFGTQQISSAGTNASGIGIFEYDVPTGYTALSTKGLNL
jgi:hypothetical protein